MSATPDARRSRDGFGMRLPGRACRCGCEDLVAVQPGAAPVTAGPVIVTRAVPDACWCAACWPATRLPLPFPASAESKAAT
jgi:hypothetical protein